MRQKPRNVLKPMFEFKLNCMSKTAVGVVRRLLCKGLVSTSRIVEDAHLMLKFAPGGDCRPQTCVRGSTGNNSV